MFLFSQQNEAIIVSVSVLAHELSLRLGKGRKVANITRYGGFKIWCFRLWLKRQFPLFEAPGRMKIGMRGRDHEGSASTKENASTLSHRDGP